jgi:hypothetical protein
LFATIDNKEVVMKRCPLYLTGFFFMMLVVYTPALFADDMTLNLDDGIEIILHDDYTWDYTSESMAELADDMSVIVDNGDAIQVKLDQTWAMIEQGDPETVVRESEELGSAFSIGTAHGPDLYIANNTAMDAAIEHLAKKLRAAIGDEKLTIVRLSYCIEEEDKSVNIKENQVKNIWQVKVDLRLDKEQIQTVLECAKDD